MCIGLYIIYIHEDGGGFLEQNDFMPILDGSFVENIQYDDDGYRTIYKADCSKGIEQMTAYEVFPGIKLVYDEFDTTNCFCGRQKSDNILEINHCIEGRSECQLQNGSYIYMGEGDFSINVLSNHAVEMGFPLGHYRGIDIIICMDEAAKVISKIIPDVTIDIYKLRDKLCPDNESFIMRANDKIERIFLDLYTVPSDIQKPYFKLKILELLLFLNVIDIAKDRKIYRYYTKQQVETVKQIKEQITMQPERRFTIEELSDEYGISETTLKSCFKGIYGTPIGMYMKTFRMHYAADLLQNSSQSVLDIAADVGYENQSRFAAAFKEIIGISPLKYRKKWLTNRAEI